MKAKYVVKIMFFNPSINASSPVQSFLIIELSYEELDDQLLNRIVTPLLREGSSNISVTDIRLLQNAPQ